MFAAEQSFLQRWSSRRLTATVGDPVGEGGQLWPGTFHSGMIFYHSLSPSVASIHPVFLYHIKGGPSWAGTFLSDMIFYRLLSPSVLSVYLVYYLFLYHFEVETSWSGIFYSGTSCERVVPSPLYPFRWPKMLWNTISICWFWLGHFIFHKGMSTPFP